MNEQSKKIEADGVVSFSRVKRLWKNEEAKSAVQSFANLATTFTAFLTLAALAWTITESSKRESQEETRNLQKPLVYSIIRDRGSSTFEEIRRAYIQKVIQAGLHKDTATDNELNRVILSLMETRVVVRDPTGRYLPTVTSTMQDQAVANMVKELEERQQAMIIRSRIISIIESESGKHTIQTLYDRLKGEGLSPSFELVANLISDLRSQRLVHKDEQKFLHDTYDVTERD